MKKLSKPVLLSLFSYVVRPAIRFCLRHSLKLNDIIDCLKNELIVNATQELTKSKLKANVSRLSVMTGVHRRDIMRLLSKISAKKNLKEIKKDGDIITRLIGQWREDKRFTTKSGEPRILSFGFETSDFHKLCFSITSDINPGTVLFELERIGAILESKTGIKLVHESYVPEGNLDAGFSILADDNETLIETVEENVIEPSEIPQFHARTLYDNVRPQHVPEIKRWFLKEGHELHARARNFVSKFDQDVNPDPKFKDKGCKVVFSAFSNVKVDKKSD